MQHPTLGQLRALIRETAAYPDDTEVQLSLHEDEFDPTWLQIIHVVHKTEDGVPYVGIHMVDSGRLD